MLPVPEAQKIKLKELTGKRGALSRRFDENPADTHLALELKLIDDQIAEWNEEIRRDRRSRQ